MSPRQICDRLSDRFHLLGNTRSSVVRHQTLRQAVAWSYDLLGQDEQLMLRCCSVFADGFDAEAVIAVVVMTSTSRTVIDLLDALVRKSLVTVERAGDRVRFDMLETIRQFAAEERWTGARPRTQRVSATPSTSRRRRARPTSAGAGRGNRSRSRGSRRRSPTCAWRSRGRPSRDDVVTAGRIAAHAAVLG